MLPWFHLAISGAQGDFGGRQFEDQPASTGIHSTKLENVAQERSICVGILAVKENVGAGNHAAKFIS
jgi:hypothetical protein